MAYDAAWQAPSNDTREACLVKPRQPVDTIELWMQHANVSRKDLSLCIALCFAWAKGPLTRAFVLRIHSTIIRVTLPAAALPDLR